MMWTTRPRSDLGGLAAMTHGEGPNVLLLHGVGLRAEAWCAQLELKARITAPDMPGHGESPWLGGDHSMETFVQAALAALHSIKGDVVVVGHSMGAMLAIELANRAASSVSAVVALNAVFERGPEAKEKVQARAAALDGNTVPDQTPTLERWFGREGSTARDACESWLYSVHPPAYKSAYTAFANSGVPNRHSLDRLQCPALFMTGSQEPNSTPAMSHAMADLAPDGRAIIVNGAAHMMPMTHPVEVNTALNTLIAEVST